MQGTPGAHPGLIVHGKMPPNHHSRASLPDLPRVAWLTLLSEVLVMGLFP